jgi:hypothetical protein
MDILDTFAVLLGIIVGLWLAYSLTDFLLLVFYHRIFTDEDRYLVFYDHMDSETDYKKLRGTKHVLKSYADFLRLHQKARSQSYLLMKENIKSIRKLSITRYGVFALIPALLFWRRWGYFLLPVIAIQLGYLLYKRYIEKRSVVFYAMLMQTMVLTEYESTTEK